ncbi:MAG TPA: hypothetical protein VHM20_07900 [Gammaproteobacteria bacterium]|jgi:hypothetical protein|nr:hypothetical protein [Gammaproteobacteria bacterium]
MFSSDSDSDFISGSDSDTNYNELHYNLYHKNETTLTSLFEEAKQSIQEKRELLTNLRAQLDNVKQELKSMRKEAINIINEISLAESNWEMTPEEKEKRAAARKNIRNLYSIRAQYVKAFEPLEQSKKDLEKEIRKARLKIFTLKGISEDIQCKLEEMNSAKKSKNIVSNSPLPQKPKSVDLIAKQKETIKFKFEQKNNLVDKNSFLKEPPKQQDALTSLNLKLETTQQLIDTNKEISKVNEELKLYDGTIEGLFFSTYQPPSDKKELNVCALQSETEVGHMKKIEKPKTSNLQNLMCKFKIK